jgi:hypothetical protein
MTDTVEIDIVDNRIVITAVSAPRQGWFPTAVNDASELESIRIDDDAPEWEWE